MQGPNKKELKALYKGVRGIKGGMNELAIRAEVTRQWAYLVLTGRGVSSSVIRHAEKLISERDSNLN